MTVHLSTRVLKKRFGLLTLLTLVTTAAGIAACDLTALAILLAVITVILLIHCGQMWTMWRDVAARIAQKSPLLTISDRHLTISVSGDRAVLPWHDIDGIDNPTRTTIHIWPNPTWQRRQPDPQRHFFVLAGEHFAEPAAAVLHCCHEAWRAAAPEKAAAFFAASASARAEMIVQNCRHNCLFFKGLLFGAVGLVGFYLLGRL